MNVMWESLWTCLLYTSRYHMPWPSLYITGVLSKSYVKEQNTFLQNTFFFNFTLSFSKYCKQFCPTFLNNSNILKSYRWRLVINLVCLVNLNRISCTPIEMEGIGSNHSCGWWASVQSDWTTKPQLLFKLFYFISVLSLYMLSLIHI